MSIQDKKIFTKLDQDSDFRAMQPGSYRYALCCRIGTTEKGNKGAVENAKGSILIANTLPSGDNINIGALEDKRGNSIIFFNYNSLGGHGIYRYFPDTGIINPVLVNSVLNFNKDFLITSASLIDDLLYWTDNYNSPRKINIGKANRIGKKLKTEVYFSNRQIVNGRDYSIGYAVSYRPPGSLLFSTETLPFPITPGRGKSGQPAQTLADVAQKFVELWNNNAVLSSFSFASSCGQSATIEALAENEETMYEISVSVSEESEEIDLNAIADNYYPTPFKEEFIEKVKYPLDCEPTVVCQQDLSRKINLIQNKVFQFRVQLIYDDYEKSALSPISAIASIPVFCGDTETQTTFNYISVGFNTDRFQDAGSLSIIREVIIMVREGNLGKFKYVTSLTKEEFLANENSYNFYNDGFYTEIADSLSNKNYDSVPLLAKSQAIGDNRSFDAGITEGYDPVCVDSKLSVSYSSSVSNKAYTINGRLYIKNLFANSSSFANCQIVISYDSGTTFGWGGVGPLNAFNDAVWSNYDDYKQTFGLKDPSTGETLRGFTVYLAGTNFRATSVQGNGVDTFSYYPFPTGGGSSEKAKRRLASKAISDNSPFSNYSIQGVPPGKYILRVASHLVTQAQLDSGNLDWQKTSTNVLAVGGVNGFECELEVMDDGKIKIGSTTYSKDSDIGDTAIADLTNNNLIQPGNILIQPRTLGLCGYMCDSDTSNTGTDVLNDTRIELADINVPIIQNPYNSLINFYGISSMAFGSIKTDHNGYFFYCMRKDYILLQPGQELKINYIRIGAFNSTGFGSLDINGSAWTWPKAIGFTGTKIGIFRNVNSSIKLYSRTKINGTVESGGLGVKNVSVISTRGKVASTDSNGDFSMYIYADGAGRKDYLIYNLQDACVGSFSPNRDYYDIAIGSPGSAQANFNSPYSGSQYNTANPDNELLVRTSTLVITSQGSFDTLKRGGKYRYGKIYLDQANRSTSVNTIDALNLYIPFYTQEGDGYKKGMASVSWSTFSLPPDWATHWMWCRTLNGNQEKYLQWGAKSIAYTDSYGNPVIRDDAKLIEIDITNITEYKTQNADSLVSYTFEDGDRIAFIKDSSGAYYDEYFDFKIKGTKSDNPLILIIENILALPNIGPGVLFEIYRSNKTKDVEVFYEINECYPVLLNKSSVKVHGGQINQEYWEFDTNYWNPTPGPTNGYCGFVGTKEHDFHVGDTVQISQDPGFDNETFNGLHTIIEVSSKKIVINVLHGATGPNPGKAIRPSSGVFKNGDAWNRNRSIPITSSTNSTTLIEDQSISDFYESESISIGRVNVVDNTFGRLYRPSTFRFSNNYISGTKINGLSTYEPLNEKVLPVDYGLINSILFIKAYLISIHENSEIISIEVGRNTLRDAGGTPQLVAIANQVVSSDYEYQGSLGTQHPESIVVDDNDDIFGIDVSKGVVWKRTGQGVVPISEIDNKNYFRNKCNDIKGLGHKIKIPAVYDRGFNQYLLTFSESNPETIAFNSAENVWEGYWPFIPEFYGRGRNNEVVSFLNGQLWRHNINPVYNNFYGVQYTQKINPVFNLSGSIMKLFINVSVEASDIWSMPAIRTLEGQLSELSKSDFTKIQNVFYADLLRDKNTPNVSDPLIFGDDLISSVLDVTMENDSTNLSVLFATNAYFIQSEKTNRT